MDTPETVAAVRRFNRFYTRAIGVLERGHLGLPYSLPETRVLYEIANGDRMTAKAVIARTGHDAGYLSRILSRFERAGLLRREPDPEDRRSAILLLTEAGREMFDTLNARQAAQVGGLVGGLSAPGRRELVEALGQVERLLEAPATVAPVVLRPHRAGDMGWVVEQHAVLYGREQGWGALMEAMVAEVVAGFLRGFDPAKEHCWIAEREGRRLGSIFIVREDDAVARLRLLLLDPAARGLKLGRRLVDESVAFARAAGYREVVLWTHRKLTAARAIYAAAGFVMETAEMHEAFGAPEMGETWRLVL